MIPRLRSEERDAPGLLRAKVLALVLSAAVLLCWPMLVLGAPLLFFDSVGYVNGGRTIVHTLLAAVSQPAGGGSGGGSSIAAAAAEAESLRSIPYAIFSYVSALTPLGLVGTTIIQTALVLLLVVALAGRAAEAPPRDIAVVAIFCGLLTSLPWFASFLMPDLLTAGVILYGAVLVSSFDRLGIGAKIVLALIAAFAISSHYGNIPLAIAVFGVALAIRLVQRRPGFVAAAAAAIVPILLTMGTNVIGSAAVLDGPSVVPRRLPVMLARSMHDGPARWHIENNCETERYAICEIFDEMPANVSGVLWGETGLRGRATTEQMDRIRQEEPIILWRAFLEYPVHQSWSLARNAIRQLTFFGSADFRPARYEWEGKLKMQYEEMSISQWRLLGALDYIWVASVVAGIAALGVFAVRDRLAFGREREILAVILVGIVTNAAIFGGLSAPAHRYESRLIWVIPLLAGLFWLERRRRSATVPGALGAGAR